MMRKIVVLGANGFIGSHLTEYLSKGRYQVIAMVDARFDYSHLKYLINTECIEFSLENLESLYADNRFDNVDFLYNLAWIGVNANFRNDNELQLQNVSYALKVMEFCKSHHIKRVLIPGSAAELSCGDGVITGKEIPAPSDIYSATKVAVRYICQTYAMQHGIDLIWTLITSIYGPGRDDNNLISYAIKTLLNGEKPSFTGLKQEWDYLYIDDLMLALEALGNYGKGGKVYPVASGTHKSMRQYVEAIRDIINPILPLGIGELSYKNPNKIDNQVFDITELKNDTGFEAKVTFEVGVKKTIDFFRNKFDYVVAGAGLSGSTFARCMAEKGKKVLVLERREEIGGNLYDERDETGIMVQKYGPHIFHTNDEDVYTFIARFADWKPFKLRCEVDMLDKSTPSPFNFKTIDQFYPANKAEELKKRLKEAYSDRTTVTIVELIESKDAMIKEYGEFLFTNDYSLYTAKQWGMKPEDVDVSVLKRVPVRIDYQEMYFTDKYECMPVNGFAAFVDKLLNHPNITVVHEDARKVISLDKQNGTVSFKGINTSKDCKFVYTGPIDELFEYNEGPLPYRSLRFEYESIKKDSYQNAPVVAYPQVKDFTRITEYKKLPEQDVEGVTIIAKEYPQQYETGCGVDPYYPIPTDATAALYQKYKQQADIYNNLILCGRLADYKYYNMDQAIKRVLELVKTIEQ